MDTCILHGLLPWSWPLWAAGQKGICKPLPSLELTRPGWDSIRHCSGCGLINQSLRATNQVQHNLDPAWCRNFRSFIYLWSPVPLENVKEQSSPLSRPQVQLQQQKLNNGHWINPFKIFRAKCILLRTAILYKTGPLEEKDIFYSYSHKRHIDHGR